MTADPRIASLNAEIDRLRAELERKDEALRDAEYALANIADNFDYADCDKAEDPCPFHELCGETVCNECGCIRDKRDRIRSVLQPGDASQIGGEDA